MPGDFALPVINLFFITITLYTQFRVFSLDHGLYLLMSLKICIAQYILRLTKDFGPLSHTNNSD